MNAISRTFGFINKHPLASRHLLRAYSAFLSWQFRSLFSDQLVPVRFVGRTKVYAKRGLNGITGNIYTGLHEFEEMAFLMHLLRETDSFFDVGANAGSYTILASGVCHSRSLSFEPIPETFETLEKNINLNQLQKKVTAINSAVGYEAGFLKFTSAQDATNHVILDSEDKGDQITVSVVRLDEYISEQPLLLKIDVEGFESQVLTGAQEMLQQWSLKAIVIELNGSGARYNFDENLIHQNLLNIGFRPYQYEPFTRKLTKLSHYGNFNTLYLRDLPFIEQRISTAKTFEIFSEHI